MVRVTGAGGFIASWIVKLLLEKGYNVKGTVRNPAGDPKNAHLRELDGAEERLTLLREAISGCHGVFQTASPVTDDPEQMLEPAVNGTRNVMIAAAEANVRRVVFTSSIGAVYMDPNRSPDAVVDESFGSDLEISKKTENWYCYGKLVAEQAALKLAKEKGVDLVVVIPPLLTYILVFKTPSAPSASGRYLSAESMLHRGEVVDILAKFFPEYLIPTKYSDEVNPRAKPYKFSTRKLRDLGMEFTLVKQCLYDTVTSKRRVNCLFRHSAMVWFGFRHKM
ncbi:hypothetical protein ACJRO7_025766 [Eucalyptus globulus]|uniref:NAD-dependent epimerase/dehydratase domain-containing protein n=1 Tax=Eucalyptus globulus TaxID=34317 RepID=A0ABD3KFE4_EUCGL